MNKHDIQLLYEYNRWANARILGAAAKLSEEQYLAPGKFPHGGLRGTLVHALFAEWVWRMRWQGTAPDYRYRLQPEDFPTFASLHARWTEDENILMEFVAALSDKKLKSELDYTSTEGGRHRRLLWEAMAHMVNHGTQHRSEAAAMLSEMGHSPNDIDLIVFLNEAPRQAPMFAQVMGRNRDKIAIFALMTLASGVCIALVAARFVVRTRDVPVE